MARREIARAKLRFGLLVVAVGMLVFLILFFQVLLGSLVTSFIGAIREQSAEVLVYGRDARKNIAGSIITPEQLAAVSEVEGVKAAAPMGEATFTLVANEAQVDASVFGYELAGPGSPTNLVEGRIPEAAGEAVASQEDEAAGFGIGSTVTTATGGKTLHIVGLTRESRYSVAPTLWVSFDDYEELRKAVNPDARAVLPSLVAVDPAPGVSPDTLARRIDAHVDGVVALTRSQAASQAPGVAQVGQSVSLILLLAFVVVTLVIGFFFLILTVQKQDSLTLLRAVGASRAYLVTGLLAQIAFVTVGGLLVGYALLAVAVSAAGGAVPLAIVPSTVLVTSFAVVLLAIAGSSVTMWRTLRADPSTVVSRQGLGGLA